MTTKKRQPSGTDFHVRNDILHALLNSEYKHLSPKLEQVALNRGEHLSGRSTQIPSDSRLPAGDAATPKTLCRLRNRPSCRCSIRCQVVERELVTITP